MIVKTNKEEYKVFKYLSLLIPKSFAERFSEVFEPPTEVMMEKQSLLRKPITIEDIKKRIVNLKDLTIGTTHNCNLRCKYCIFGGKYPHSRTHNINSMEMDTFKKAIDFYFSLVNSPLRSTRDDIVLSFYGGEPLLKFDNILKAYDYAKEKACRNPIKRNLIGMMSTNAVLLNQLQAKELLERNFKISISLDGPKDQHDKLRVKIDNTGTFDDILFNITNLKKRYPDKYRENIRYLLTIHPFHNIKRIEEFFLSNDEVFNERNLIIATVDLDKIKGHYKKKWHRANLKQLEQINNKLDKDKWFYKKMLFSWLERLYINPTQILKSTTNFTGTCFPGVENMYVDVDGSIHICEKINPHFPIGNVFTGIDMAAIIQLMKKWNEIILKRKCWDCDAWWLCNFCFASRADDRSININKENCQAFLKSAQRSISKFLNILEREDEIKNINRYSNIDSYLDSL